MTPRTISPVMSFVLRSRDAIATTPAAPDARPWLYGIATNVLRRHRRSGWRRWRAYARLDWRDAVDLPDADAVVRRLDAQALAPTLDRALATLSAGDRDVLLLFAWANLSYSEIAEALGLPSGTVKSRLHRARHVLREHLAASEQQIKEQPAPSVTGDSHG